MTRTRTRRRGPRRVGGGSTESDQPAGGFRSAAVSAESSCWISHGRRPRGSGSEPKARVAASRSSSITCQSDAAATSKPLMNSASRTLANAGSLHTQTSARCRTRNSAAPVVAAVIRGNPGAAVVEPICWSPVSAAGASRRSPASVTQSIAVMSAVPDCTAWSERRCEPVSTWSPKNVRSTANGATSARKALAPECESNELIAAVRPRKSSIAAPSPLRAMRSLL